MEVRLGLGELYSEVLELEVEDSLLSELSLEELPRRLRRPLRGVRLRLAALFLPESRSFGRGR